MKIAKQLLNTIFFFFWSLTQKLYAIYLLPSNSFNPFYEKKKIIYSKNFLNRKLFFDQRKKK